MYDIMETVTLGQRRVSGVICSTGSSNKSNNNDSSGSGDGGLSDVKIINTDYVVNCAGNVCGLYIYTHTRVYILLYALLGVLHRDVGKTVWRTTQCDYP